MVFGGLRPIASRIVLDAVAVASLAYCTFTPVEDSINTLLLVSAALLTVATADFTNRWTVTFPMVPVLVLQSIRRLSIVSEIKWVSVLIAVLTTLFLIVMVALSLLFPAVTLPPIKGKYNIGMVSLHLPVDYSKLDDNKSPSPEDDYYVNVRILYPTNEKPDRLPYLDPSTAADFLAQCINFGAPPPLKKFGWLLHNWRLIQLDVKHNAIPIASDGLPVVVYSHGLGGSPSIYSYQTHTLAANGYLVLAIEHSDGSAPLTKKRDGNVVTYDYAIGKLWSEGNEVEYVRK
jgi:platelet-activating factor acetylhydrolase